MADAHAELIRQAVLQARQGHSQEAIALLLGSPVSASSSSAAHYHLTLGSLLLQQGRSGEAFAHLDAALRREPNLKTIRELWNQAREQSERTLGEGSLELASSSIEKVVDHPLFVPVEALFAVTAAAAGLQYLRRRRLSASRRPTVRLTAVLWFMAAIASGIHFWGSRFEKCRSLQEITLRSGPSEDFIELDKVEPGAELRLLAQRDGWFRVRVSPEVSGWAPASSVLLLNPPSTTREP